MRGETAERYGRGRGRSFGRRSREAQAALGTASRARRTRPHRKRVRRRETVGEVLDAAAVAYVVVRVAAQAVMRWAQKVAGRTTILATFGATPRHRTTERSCRRSVFDGGLARLRNASLPAHFEPEFVSETACTWARNAARPRTLWRPLRRRRWYGGDGRRSQLDCFQGRRRHRGEVPGGVRRGAELHGDDRSARVLREDGT